MDASLLRSFLSTTIVLCAVAPALALAGCAPPESWSGSTLHFAVSTASEGSTSSISPALRVGTVRVLSRHVNLQEPVLLGTDGGSVTVTFARRERDGATLALHPASLEERSVTAYAYAAHATRAAPPFLAAEPSRVRLASGGSVSCWTDEESGRVHAQAFSADGGWVGSPLAVSPEGMNVFGAPQLVATDSHHAVVVFFVSTEDGFELVAASLEHVR
jgi:hypothetical protein